LIPLDDVAAEDKLFAATDTLRFERALPLGLPVDFLLELADLLLRQAVLLYQVLDYLAGLAQMVHLAPLRLIRPSPHLRKSLLLNQVLLPRPFHYFGVNVGVEVGDFESR
jgi:hypothetical protein